MALVRRDSGDRPFKFEDLALLLETQPVLIALDGLDEVANLEHRDIVSDAIVRLQRRLSADAADLVVLVATRPGGSTSALWSTQEFPIFRLMRLTQGLQLQYLQQWASVARLSETATANLQTTFLHNRHAPHIRELAAYPMQLAILLYLLYRRRLLPQQRTDLYADYLETFLDREETEEKEPLLRTQRKVIEDVHAFLGWDLQIRAEDGQTPGSISRAALRQRVHENLSGRTDAQQFADTLFSAISSRVLCLIERDTGRFEFEVQPLREYFAARYIFENAPPKGVGNSRDDCLNAILERPYWSNVARFFVGMFSGVEVRGIRQNLRAVGSGGDLGRLPLLRSTAALFLDDRTFEGQADEPIQEIVDFILDGAGVVFAEDGLLDTASDGLCLTDGAGRVQAIEHIKRRLTDDNPYGVRHALASSLARHAGADDAAAWWWTQVGTSGPSWLATAAQLSAFRGLNTERAGALTSVLTTLRTGVEWSTGLLLVGGYDGNLDSIVQACVDEINAGAAEVLEPAGQSPLAQLLTAARSAVRPTPLPDAQPAPTHTRSRRRTRVRRRAELLDTITNAARQLPIPAPGTGGTEDWLPRLESIHDTWHDGWILRRSIAAMPEVIDLAALARVAESTRPVLASALEWEAAGRCNRNQESWWRAALSSEATFPADDAHRVVSLLTTARFDVVVAVAELLNFVTDRLAPRQYAAIRRHLEAARAAQLAPTLHLMDPIRLNTVDYSARVLWLLRVVATDATIPYIDKRLADRIEGLLQPGMGDMRSLLHAVGNIKPTRTIKITTLRHSRSLLPPGGWASDVKLGAISARLAADILDKPHEWPADVVQRAVEGVSKRRADTTGPLSAVATRDNWFP